jgi:hypothetical protein
VPWVCSPILCVHPLVMRALKARREPGQRDHQQRGRLPISQAQQDVEASTNAFKVHTPLEIRVKLEIAKVDVHLDRNLVLDEEVDVELCPWISDTGSSQTREMKYHKTTNLYWHIKSLLGKMLTKRNGAHNEILTQMEYIQLQIKAVYHKITLLARKTSLELINSRENHQHVPEEVANYPPV